MLLDLLLGFETISESNIWLNGQTLNRDNATQIIAYAGRTVIFFTAVLPITLRWQTGTAPLNKFTPPHTPLVSQNSATNCPKIYKR